MNRVYFSKNGNLSRLFRTNSIRPTKNNFMRMKKLIPIVLFATAILPISSCKSQPSVEKTENKTEKQEITGVKIEHLTPATFKSKVFDYEGSEYKFVGNKPCIIDFYANWCGPCKIMAPTLQTIAEEYKDKIIVYKVDVDAQKELASSFGITGIPALLFCPANAKPQMSQGLLSRADLDKAISEVLLK